MRSIQKHELGTISGGMYVVEPAVYSFNDVYWMHEEASIDALHTAIFTSGVAATVFLSYNVSLSTLFWGTLAMGAIGYNIGYKNSDVWDLY